MPELILHQRNYLGQVMVGRTISVVMVIDHICCHCTGVFFILEFPQHVVSHFDTIKWFIVNCHDDSPPMPRGSGKVVVPLPQGDLIESLCPAFTGWTEPLLIVVLYQYVLHNAVKP